MRSLSEECVAAIFVENYTYNFNETRSAEFSFLPTNTSNSTPFTYDDVVFLNKKYPKWNDVNNEELICIQKGFHSMNKKRAKKEYWTSNGIDGSVYECIIPAGAKYYEDTNGLLVSNSIIVTKRKLKG